MKYALLITVILISIFSYGQSLIPLDSLKNFIVSDSVLQNCVRPFEFVELKNTALGVVVYEPCNNIVSFNQQQDTLIETDGFETYHWKIISKDTLEGNLRMVGSCVTAWENARSEFIFKQLKANYILLTRIIYDEDGTEILRYEKVILEKQRIFDFVCLREPTPGMPGSDIPFITLDPNNFLIAPKEAFFKL